MYTIDMKIPNYPMYDITPEGVVTNIKLDKIITPVVKNGYFGVRLSREGRLHYKSLHKLVYETFIGIVPDGMQVNHKDGIRNNNVLSNLEVCSSQENSSVEKMIFRAKGEQVNTAKLTEQQVMELRKARVDGASTKELMLKYNLNKSSVLRIIKGISWKHLPIYPDDPKWKDPQYTGGISGKTLRSLYGEDYFSLITKSKKFKKHCATCTCGK